MRVEQEQRVTEDARVCAEQDAAAQKYVLHVVQVNWLAIITMYLKITFTSLEILKISLCYK
jgi:hypothetical protein